MQILAVLDLLLHRLHCLLRIICLLVEQIKGFFLLAFRCLHALVQFEVAFSCTLKLLLLYFLYVLFNVFCVFDEALVALFVELLILFYGMSTALASLLLQRHKHLSAILAFLHHGLGVALCV